jgi:ribosomal protein L40E
VSADSNETTPEVPTASLACSKCGAALPEEAQFCLKCGKPVSMPSKQAEAAGQGFVVQSPQAGLPRPKRKHWRIALWIFLGLVLVGIVWAATSDNPFAQGLQELAGFKHDQAILEAETPFTVAAHSFRYYKFALPEGSTHVSIVGQFNVVTAAPADKQNATNKSSDAAVDNGIQVYVLSEPAFAVWQNGYATSSVYESGKVSDGTLQSELPAGAGIYYLVFSNKTAPKLAKNVTASILLRYKSWVPAWVRSLKERFLNWTGL